MSNYIAGYLIIFTPLLFSIVCFLAPARLDFSIFIIAIIILALLIFNITPDLLIYGKLTSDINLESTVSILTEYYFDFLAIFFLFLVIFNKFMINIYYQADIKKSINDGNRKMFYSVSLLNLFGLVGIFTTNNIINLYIFIEIYSLTFYAIMSMSNDENLTKLSFKYFTWGIIGSILILLAFLSLYIITGEAHINLIINDIGYILKNDYTMAVLIFFITIIAILVKFFPIWLYLEKIKRNNFFANFLSTSSLFIKTNIGLYLLIRIIFFLFGIDFSFAKLNFNFILFLAGSGLIIYGNIQLLKYQHLKIIASNLCLINLGLALIGISLALKESISASFLYIINYSFTNLMIFLFASYLSRNFSNCNIENLHIIRKNNFIVGIPLKAIIFFIAGFPMTMFFLANWQLAYATSNLLPSLFVIILLITTNFAVIKLVIKMINYFYFYSKEEAPVSTKFFSKQENFLYSISFWIMLSIALYFAIFSNILISITNNLSIYLLSNTI